jgi:hypothetical protein
MDPEGYQGVLTELTFHQRHHHMQRRQRTFNYSLVKHLNHQLNIHVYHMPTKCQNMSKVIK